MQTKAIVISALGGLMSLGPSLLQAGTADLSAVVGSDDQVERLRELAPLIETLRPEDFPAALKQVIAGHGDGRDDAIDALSGRWVELDAPAALAFARLTSDREARQSIETAYYGAWAERDPDEALKAANQTGGGERAEAIWQIAHAMGTRDPQRAHDLIQSVHSAKMEDSDYFIFWNWAGINLGQANQTLLQDAKVAGQSYPCETAVWAITDRLLDENPKLAEDWVNNLPPGPLRVEAFDRLVSEWKKVDPESLAVWLKSSPDSDQVRNAILNLPQKPAEPPPLRVAADPAFATKAGQLDKILWDGNFWHELEALLPFVDGLTSSEFPQALEHLRNTPDSNRDVVTDVLMARWSKVDPAGAIKALPFAETIHDSEFFPDRFLSDVYAGWSQRDPEAALAAATRDDHGVGDCNVLQAIFAAFARQDPAKAYAAFRKLNDANSHLLVVPIFTEWAARDLSAATKALPTEPDVEGAIEGIVRGLMRQGPAAAIAWAEHLPPQPYRDRALQDVALRWPDDPAAAAAWLEKAPAFDGKDSALDDVAVDWAGRDTMEALHYALALPDGKEKDSLLYWGLQQLTYDDAEAAQRFVQQLSGDEMKQHALATVLGTWSEYDPGAAAAYLSTIPNEATPTDVAEIATSLSDHDPVSAAHWLNTLPASVDKAPAIGKIAENWYRRDSSAAESWVNHMPAGPLYDAGAGGICTALDSDLPPALKWARSIRDSKMRHGAVYHAFETAIYTRMRFGMLSESQGMKDEINGTPELTDSEKTALIARLPVLTFFAAPQALKPPQAPANP